MIVVANSDMLNIFKRISIFKFDLGQSLMSMKEDKIVIKDPFMLKYLNMTVLLGGYFKKKRIYSVSEYWL